MDFLARFSKYDTFAKAQSHIQVRTHMGAVLSVLTVVLMGMLLVSEFSYFRSKRVEHRLMVDTGQGDREFTIDMDIAFPATKCKDLDLRLEDSKGMAHEDAKLRVGRSGADAMGQDTRAADAPGCVLKGSITVKRVAGNFHIVAGRMAPQIGFLMAQPAELMNFNVSHIIRKLAFGPAFPGQLQPLDGVTSAPADGPAQYQYHIKLVPTLFEPVSGRLIDSEQFSVTDFVQTLDASKGMMGQPGVWFRYDFSPIMVRVVETRESLLGFLVSVCAILGGVFTLSGIIDQVFYRAMETRKSK